MLLRMKMTCERTCKIYAICDCGNTDNALYIHIKNFVLKHLGIQQCIKTTINMSVFTYLLRVCFRLCSIIHYSCRLQYIVILREVPT